jgi:flagellar hook assembly protein FlgD
VPVYVARKAEIKDYSIGPNPTADGANFFVNYISPKIGNTLVVEIYDIVGKKVRTLSKPIGLNEDYIYWDGMDFEGRSTPKGVYFFKISVMGEIFSDPVFGKLIKIQ